MPDQPPKVESKRREGSSNPDSKTDYQFRRRLALCLDGTWNERDSGTNIYHLSNLILEGKIEPGSSTQAESTLNQPASFAQPGGTVQEEAGETWVQMVYYDEGVGTGLLDNVTGGALGKGLSENVREAYDWLVERYRDDDEIYIFGFSRGAYTARSLVGMIAHCGLLYRGAPLPPEQLWNGYTNMKASRPGPGSTGASRFPGRPKPGLFRPLQYLKKDTYPGAIPYRSYIDEKEWTATEELLCRWSRRIPIHCLGIFDTVRTLGIEFLAIPWLRDRKTQFHKTQLTWLIQNGFHALAIDEHRANFRHVPWHRKTILNTKMTEDRADKSGGIQQRWFIGAHSNIGGSYDDGTLAQLPLAWFIFECKKLGLVFKPVEDERDVRKQIKQKDGVPLLTERDATTGELRPGRVRDAYTELGRGIWRHLLRAKRHYRRIAPPPEFEDGDEVVGLNEELDESVLKLIGLNAAKGDPYRYNPPNLYEYLARPKPPNPPTPPDPDPLPEPPKLPEPPDIPAPPKLEKPSHKYLDSWIAATWLVIWLGGLIGAGKFLAILIAGSRDHWLHWALPIGLPVIGWAVDWLEDRLTHERAVRPRDAVGEKLDGWLDLLMNLRMIAVGLFVLGAGFAIWRLCLLVWFAPGQVPLAEVFWLVAFCGMLMRFNASRSWAARPMQEAEFGSIVQLQNAKTPAEVVALRRAWMQLCLKPGDAAKLDDEGLKGYHTADPHRLLPVHRTIWRDRIGFIPAYSVAFLAGLWVTLSLLQGWLGIPRCSEAPIWGLLSQCRWCWLPAVLIVGVAVLADYIEDSIHIGYLKDHTGTPKPGVVRFGWLLSKIKLFACLVGMAGLLGAVVLLGLLQLCHAFVNPEKCPFCQGLFQNVAATSTVPALVGFLFLGLAASLALTAIRGLLKREPEVRCE